MPWIWYDPAAGNLSDDQLTGTIKRLQETANVHQLENFPGGVAGHLVHVKNKAVAGYLVIACKTMPSPLHADQTIYFQKSKALSAISAEDVWVVSYGFQQSILPGNAPQVACQNFIRANISPQMRKFMQSRSLHFLYSIDKGPKDLAPLGRRIGRLQTLGEGHQWRIVSEVTISGTEDYHYFWGGPDGVFRLTKFEDTGAP